MTDEIALGGGHFIQIGWWDPDLDLNPDLAYLAATDQIPARVSGIVRHDKPDGSQCEGAITFDSPVAREHFKGPFWTVECWDPLSLSPSLLCHCGDHGFIRGGRWVAA